MPRFESAHLQHNLEVVERVRALADARGVSVVQLVIAWVLSRGADIVPVIGARTRAQLDEMLVHDGEMASLDSER